MNGCDVCDVSMCQKQLERIGSLLPPHGPGDGTQISRLGSKHLYPLALVYMNQTGLSYSSAQPASAQAGIQIGSHRWLSGTKLELHQDGSRHLTRRCW